MECAQMGMIFVNLAGDEILGHAIGSEMAGAFADVPLDGVEAIAAVGDVRDAE